jgi:hypothetical protein
MAPPSDSFEDARDNPWTAWNSVSQSMASVALTLPGYWPQNPDAWFVKVEAQLKSAKITSEETRFYKVLAVLPESAAIRVREITHNTDFKPGDYDRLKQKLIQSSQPSILERLDRLCDLKNVAHKKPSEALLDIEVIFHSVKKEHVIPSNDFVKKFWWIRALPSQIQQNILPVAETSSLDELVIVADQMFASHPPVERVSEIHTSSQRQSRAEEQEIGPWSGESDDQVVSAIHEKSKAARGQKTMQVLFCKYYARYKDKARRCVPGCSRFGKF